MNETSLITSSFDKSVKILSLNLELKGFFNVNHPLPIRWDIELNKEKSILKKIHFALEIIEDINKKSHYDEILGRKMRNMNFFLNDIIDQYITGN